MELQLRLILCGGSGVGKSAVGNTILGREEFLSGIGAHPITINAEKRTSHIYGRDVIVIDTPSFEEPDLEDEFKNAISLSNPGPHAFILVVPLGLKSRDHRLLDKLQRCSGEGVEKFIIVLFTGGYTLGQYSLEERLKGGDKDLEELVTLCGNTYHVFDNTASGLQNQVLRSGYGESKRLQVLQRQHLSMRERVIMIEGPIKETEKLSEYSPKEYVMMHKLSEEVREEAESSDESLSFYLKTMRDGLQRAWQTVRR